jgi:lysophospholipase L1-like esterase
VKGLEDLAEAAQQQLTISRGVGSDVPSGNFRHQKVGANRKPLTKLSAFESALGDQTSADVALLKFCYVDVEPATDVAALFAAYEETLARLEAKHPHATFVRATVPLRTFQRGAKATLKKLLGRDTGERANESRERFNALVRTAAARANAPIFDIARLLSTRPDGSTEEVEWQQRRVPGLVASYTDDGGHLNLLGRQRAARELAAVLAAAPLRGLSSRRGH